ncbi:Werner syndrome ATP-dependent helicase homolog [Dendronephthya gigantea]|uniref:Werner syndrome ATP-dependent helicase homolog n=1 Tax=Dendronephthya gigantea TaxID=151771 RepID=UPI00106A5437|nr:Werner syndrome ATP-dependent helicase homolog [Dendronephthya gigantea]
MAKSAPRKLPACFQQGMGESGLQVMKFHGKVYYCSQKDDCNFICNQMRTESTEVVGFDIEWKVTFTNEVRRTALIQLCPSRDICYLFHISMMNGFPSELKLLLESEAITKVGVGIHNDMQKLTSDFGVKAKGYSELSDLANLKLKTSEKWSLKGLTMNLFKQRIPKDNKVRCSDWEKYPLSRTQESYAALDAYVGYAIYMKLVEME